MTNKSWAYCCIFFAFILQVSHIQGQRIEKKVVLSWGDNIVRTISEDETREFLHFDGAVYPLSFPTLPSYYEQIPIAQFYDKYDITVSNVEYAAMSASDAALVPANYHSRTLDVQAHSAHARTSTYLMLSFIPIVFVPRWGGGRRPIPAGRFGNHNVGRQNSRKRNNLSPRQQKPRHAVCARIRAMVQFRRREDRHLQSHLRRPCRNGHAHAHLIVADSVVRQWRQDAAGG